MNEIELFLGDCLEVMKRIPDGVVDCIIMDPPYGSLDCDWDVELDLGKMWEQFNRIAKKDAPIIIFSAQPFTSKLVMSNPSQYRCSYYWRKSIASGFQFSAHQPMRAVEEICVFSRAAIEYHPPQVRHEKPFILHRKKRIKSECYGGKEFKGFSADNEEFVVKEFKTQTNFLEYPSISRKGRYINTQKPVDLMKFFVETYSKEGDLVADVTMGSCSTGIAARDLNRRFLGIEKSKKHYAIALKRIYQIEDIEEVFDLVADELPEPANDSEYV